MEFELEQISIPFWELTGQAQGGHEETREAIVPDACPDILRIADICAQVTADKWSSLQGQVSVQVSIKAAVLYIPESGAGMRCMEVSMPVTCELEIPGAVEHSAVQGTVRLKNIDGRVLNPRKVLIRAELWLDACAYTQKEQRLSTCAADAEEHICQQIEQVEHERLTALPQRIFPISEELRLTGAEAPTLLCARGEARCTECRVIGSKLIFKGLVDTELLLCGADGAVERRLESLPFSQLLDLKQGAESCTGQVRLSLCELTCLQLSDDPFRVMVEGEVLACGQVRCREQLSILTDLYSTACELKVEQQPLCLYAPMETTVLPQTLREILETQDTVRCVCGGRFELWALQEKRERERLICTVYGRAVILYLDEERQLRRLEKRVELPVGIACPSDARAVCLCQNPDGVYAAPCAGGIEARISLQLHISISCPIRCGSVSCVVPVQECQHEGERPSIILRMPEPGEGLWDIAKACGTTKERIIRANGLEGDEVPRQKMLLIPGVR